MNTEQEKQIALNLFNKVKKTLAENKKYNKNAFGWRERRGGVDISIGYKYNYLNAKDERYVIRLEGEIFAEFISLYDLRETISYFKNYLAEQKKVRGWSTLATAEDYVTFGNGWSTTRVDYPCKVMLPNPPCKEYKALRNYIQKYGVDKYRALIVLRPYEFFSSAMGGKRGRLWDEYGERQYLENKPKKCARVLEELRKYRGTKDIMLCERGQEDYIDEMERRYSEYHEVECDGEKRHFLTITIKTPQGKVKYQQKIY